MSHSVTKKRENHRKVAEYSNKRAYSETGPQSTRNSHLDAAALRVDADAAGSQPRRVDAGRLAVFLDQPPGRLAVQMRLASPRPSGRSGRKRGASLSFLMLARAR